MSNIDKSMKSKLKYKSLISIIILFVLLMYVNTNKAQTSNGGFTFITPKLTRPNSTIIIRNNESDKEITKWEWNIENHNTIIQSTYKEYLCITALNFTGPSLYPVSLKVQIGNTYKPVMVDTIIILPFSFYDYTIIEIPKEGAQYLKFYADNNCRYFVGSSNKFEIYYDDALRVDFKENERTDHFSTTINVYNSIWERTNILNFTQSNQITIDKTLQELGLNTPQTNFNLENGDVGLFKINHLYNDNGGITNIGEQFKINVNGDINDDYTITIIRSLKSNITGNIRLLTTEHSFDVNYVTGDDIFDHEVVTNIYGAIKYNNPQATGLLSLSMNNRDYAPYISKLEVYSVINNNKTDLPFYASEWKSEDGKLVCQGTINNCLVHMPENQMEIHVYTSEEMASLSAKLLEEPGTSVDIVFDAAKSSNNTYVYNCNKSLFNANNLYTIELTGEDITGNQLMPLVDKEIKYALKYKSANGQPVTFADNQKDISHTFHILNYNGGNADECPSVLYFDYDVVDKTVTFTNLSILNGDIGARCNWKFSEAGSYTYNPNTTVTHTYTKNGTYEVTLQVTENTTGVYRGLDKFIKNVTIQTNFQSDAADVKIKFEAIEHPSSLPPHKRSVKLKYISTIDDIADVQWTLDGSAPVSDLMPEFICVLNNTYTVNLTLTFNDSSTISKTVKIIVNNADGIIIP